MGTEPEERTVPKNEQPSGRTLRINRRGKASEFGVDEAAIQELEALRTQHGETPRVGILVLTYNASDLLAETVARIPRRLDAWVDEIFVFDDASTDDTLEVARQLLRESPWRDKLEVFANPVNLGYGGNQKVGFDYAVRKGFDYVVLLHGDGQYAPEHLPELLLPLVRGEVDVVFGSRMLRKVDALSGGMPLYKFIGNRILTTFENLILGLDLSEFHSGYRIYRTDLLRRIPFVENSNGFHFDSEIIVQVRAAGAEVAEVPVKTYYGTEVCHVNGLDYAFNVCKTVLEYRLHQLHVIRRARFMIREDVVYTRKQSPYSSHGQVLDLIESPGLALDLGSDIGLLTEDLLDRGVESIGVDLAESSSVTAPFKEYIRTDLENYEALEFSHRFDYIVLADVLQHLTHAQPLLQHVRRFLKPDGRLIVSVPNIAVWFYRLSLLVGRFNYGPKGILDEAHVRFYTLDTIRSALVQCGYSVERERFTGLPFEVVFESTGSSSFLKSLEWLYFRLVKLWPRMFAYQLILEAALFSPPPERARKSAESSSEQKPAAPEIVTADGGIRSGRVSGA